MDSLHRFPSVGGSKGFTDAEGFDYAPFAKGFARVFRGMLLSSRKEIMPGFKELPGHKNKIEKIMPDIQAPLKPYLRCMKLELPAPGIRNVWSKR